MLAEAHALYGAGIEGRADISAITRARIAAGARIGATDHERATALRQGLTRRMAGAMDSIDALIQPVTPDDPPIISEIDPLDFLRSPLLTAPANIAGFPAISVPCGLSARGLPMAVQIMGRRGGDSTVLRIAHAFESFAASA